MGKNHHCYKGGQDKVSCSNCKSILFRHKYIVNKTSVYFCNYKCRGQYFSGENCNLYVNGKAIKKSRYISQILRDDIRRRDKFTCQYCELEEIQQLERIKKKLSIHHIDYNKENNRYSNLITLCNQCHGKTQINRDYWYVYFMNNKIEGE